MFKDECAMNPAVQKLINKAKVEELKQREEYLRSLGLVDKSKKEVKRKYIDYVPANKYGYAWDSDKKKYFRSVVVNGVLEITDEEYDELLKYYPCNEKTSENVSPPKYSKKIKILALSYIVLNVCTAVVCLALSNGPEILLLAALISLFNCIWYPFICGYANIVEAAEKYLSK